MKQKLMFELDEGIAGNELLSIYEKDYAALDAALDRITEGFSPLQKKYEVVYQIYPTWNYRERGYRSPASEPLNRISDVLKHTFEYFAKKGLGLYLEMHSSGIRTNQNGELGTLPPAPLHYGEEEKCKSLPMDMECLIALKKAYPATFRGIRFHELVGSHEIGLHDRALGKEEHSHAFVVQDRVIRGMIDACKTAGLELVWSDHMFNDIFERPDLFACFRGWVDYAVDTLGADQVTFNWANNGWPMHKYIVGKFLLKNYRGAHTGMSVQSWFWQELDSSTMVCLQDGGFDVKWHAYAEMDCPIELMAIFTKKYLDDGCTLIQFEPPHYFLNYYRPSKKVVAYSGCVEEKPDCSLREHTKRFIEMLLHPEEMKYLSTDLLEYFDSDKKHFVYNLESDPAKRYEQNTLFLIGKDKSVHGYDWFNNGACAIENNKHRIYDGILKGDLQYACRAHMGYSGIDDYLLLKRENGVCVGYFYNTRSGMIKREEKAFADTDEGKVVAAAAMNVCSRYEKALDGEADEIILVRRKADKQVSFELLRAKSKSGPLERKFELVKVRNKICSALKRLVSSAAFCDIAALRCSNSVNADATRKEDTGIAVLVETKSSKKVRAYWKGEKISFNVPKNTEKIVSVDMDQDVADEIAVLIKRKKGYSIRFYDLEKRGWAERSIDSACKEIAVAFSNRAGFNTKAFDPVFKNLDNALI